MFEPEFWVAVAFVIFLGILVYFGVHRLIIDALDRRSALIKAELEEAQRLKADAQKLLADYQRRQQEVKGEADAIIAGARAEAERIAVETKARMEDFLARRTRIAEAKIEQAEVQAVADVRAAAADAAVAAAERILRESAKGQVADDLIANGIADVRSKLN